VLILAVEHRNRGSKFARKQDLIARKSETNLQRKVRRARCALWFEGLSAAPPCSQRLRSYAERRIVERDLDLLVALLLRRSVLATSELFLAAMSAT
jgi:hypothetical protein